MKYFMAKNNTNNTENITIWFSLIAPDVYTINPAFENIPKNVITSRIINQFPMLDAPYGNGRLENLANLNLSTWILATLEINAIIYDTGNANPNNAKNEN